MSAQQGLDSSRHDVPDLQSPGSQDPRSFVFGQVRRGHADSVGLGHLSGPDARCLKVNDVGMNVSQ